MRKYRIDELLAKYSRQEKQEIVVRMADALGVGLSRLRRIRSIRLADSRSITVDQLRIIANVLEVEWQELVYEPEEDQRA